MSECSPLTMSGVSFVLSVKRVFQTAIKIKDHLLDFGMLYISRMLLLFLFTRPFDIVDCWSDRPQFASDLNYLSDLK